MLFTRRSAYAEGTLLNLKTQWTVHLLFCNFYELNPFSISVDLLCTYSQFLSRTFKSAQSMGNYLNGVKILFLLHGCIIDIFSSFEIKMTPRGLNRKLKHLPKQALPLTLEILDKKFNFMDMNNSLDATFWCLFLFAFFLMSRKSNLVPTSVKTFDSSKF